MNIKYPQINNKSALAGFTLIELLVVIAIIGILATIATIGLTSVRAKARDTKRIADVKQTQTALEVFYSDHNRYPTEDEWLTGSLVEDTANGTTTYMAKLPVAPTIADGACSVGDNQFDYIPINDGASYNISYCLGAPVANINSGLNCASADGLNTGLTLCLPDPNPSCNPSDSVSFDINPGNNYREVHTCCELQHIADDPTQSYELANNLNCNNTNTWNLDGSSVPHGFTPIQNFSGDFKGHDFRIDGLYIYNPALTDGVGIFGTADGSSFSNIRLSNFNIFLDGLDSWTHVGSLVGYDAHSSNKDLSISSISASGGMNFSLVNSVSYVGGLIGEINEGSASVLIHSLFYKGNLSFSTGDSNTYIGGLIGNDSGNGSPVKTINNLTYNGNLSFSAGAGNAYVGGLIGAESSNNSSLVNISYLTHNTAVSGGENFSTGGGNYGVGGLIGYISANDLSSIKLNNLVSNIKNGSVEFNFSTGGGNNGVGGLIGLVYSQDNSPITITNLTSNVGSGSTGNLSFSTGAGNIDVGGLIGLVYSQDNSPIVISNLNNNAGQSSGSNISFSSAGGNNYVGGLIGQIHAGNSSLVSISRVSNEGNIDLSTAYTNDYLGGLFGYVNAAQGISLSYFSQFGNIYDMGAYVGGVVGGLYPGDTSLISQGSNSGTIAEAIYDAGGLFGYIDSQINNISFAYTNASVGLLGGGLNGCAIGGVGGGATVNLDKTYYNYEICGLADNGYGTAKSATDLKTLSTYVNDSWPICNNAGDIWHLPSNGQSTPCLSWTNKCTCD